ncbi:hypothetical protein I79_009625 [Cricetulus griseus]|uniref:Uncharacterized protein n=1 Tax=Cricetulus griseus TaxID=10029 RepID=G3HGA5_CRIGR|nr:hypothetical protein I79_009625 [Cricetulus griseus]
MILRARNWAGIAAPSVLSTLSPEPLAQKRVDREAEELDVAITRHRRLLEQSRGASECLPVCWTGRRQSSLSRRAEETWNLGVGLEL